MAENSTNRSKPEKKKSANKGTTNSNNSQVEVLPWQNQEVYIVDDVNQCRDLAKKLRLHCSSYNVLGIGGDWTRFPGKKMSLLLLSTHDGLCAVIRLSNLKRIPTELMKILEDENILKVTVGPVAVAMQLAVYGVYVASVFDLRFLAVKCGSKPWPLPKLSVQHLNVKLSENYRLEQMRWRGMHSSNSDVKYAAKSVRVPIELFKLFEDKLKDPSCDKNVQKFIDDHCKEHLNKSFQFENLPKNESIVNVDEKQIKVLLPKPIICTVGSVEKCEKAIRQLREHSNKYKVLGFGCRMDASRSTATLLQLATRHGFCALIQMSKFKQIPEELKKLLEDESIIKVGGRAFPDADRFQRDYGISIANTIDLRHLAKDCAYRSDNFDRLSKEVLNVDLGVDDWRLLATDWTAVKVSDNALNYAAKTVQVTIELFKVFEEKLVKEKYSGDRGKFIDGICQAYSNEDFPKKNVNSSIENETISMSEQKIHLVENADECKAVVNQLLSDCNAYNVLGFDCEWVPVGQRKVAMLQLASNSGLCALIRLCKLEKIPNELRDILKDETILKVGITPNQDVSKLKKDYRLEVKGALDLVRLAKKCQYKGTGLALLAQEVLNVKMPLKKDGLIVRKLHSQWEKDKLKDENIKYAANDVHVSIELFKRFEKKLSTKNPEHDQNSNLQQFIYKYCVPHAK